MTAPLQQGGEGAVAGEAFGGPMAGEAFGGPAGGEAFGIGAGEALPFTGSVLTVPLAILGLVLTFSGWIVRQMGRNEDAE